MNDLEIAAKFAGLHGLDENRVRTRQIRRGALVQWIDDHEGLLWSLDLRQEDAFGKFERPDYIALGGERRSGQIEPAFYLAVETPFAIRERDIDKVTDNAKILRAVTGLAAYPVVASGLLDPVLSDGARARLYEDVAGYVVARDADVALWYWLDPEAD